MSHEQLHKDYFDNTMLLATLHILGGMYIFVSINM